jgi:AraC-like DNA-binding protein
MARHDPLNRARFRMALDLGDVQLLRADFQTHRFERHVHDELVLVVTERGAGRYLSRGTRDFASTDAVGVFNPGEPHEGGVFDPARGWQYRAIYVGPQALQRLGEAVVGQQDVVPYVRRNAVVDGRLARLVVATHAALEESSSRLTRETRLIEVYAHLLSGAHAEIASVPAAAAPFDWAEGRPERDRGARARVARALEVMHDRFTENVSVDELATVTGLSPFHFIRTFRSGFGMPPHAYLTQIRLRHARAALASGIAPADAAIAAGFCDQSHLTKHFKRSYGITPAQYAAALDVSRASSQRSRREQF